MTHICAYECIQATASACLGKVTKCEFLKKYCCRSSLSSDFDFDFDLTDTVFYVNTALLSNQQKQPSRDRLIDIVKHDAAQFGYQSLAMSHALPTRTLHAQQQSTHFHRVVLHVISCSVSAFQQLVYLFCTVHEFFTLKHFCTLMYKFLFYFPKWFKDFALLQQQIYMTDAVVIQINKSAGPILGSIPALCCFSDSR